MKVKKAGWVLS